MRVAGSKRFGVASAPARATVAVSVHSRPCYSIFFSRPCALTTQCGSDAALLLQHRLCRSRSSSSRSSSRSLVVVVSAAAASTTQASRRRRPRSTIDMPDGLRAPPYTGSPEQRAAVSKLLERSKLLGDIDEETAIWFLRDRSFDVDEAVDKLRRYSSWRSRVSPHLLTDADVSREAATGKAFLHSSRDSLGRPAVVIRCSRHVVGEFPHESSVRLASFVLEKAVSQLEEEEEEGDEGEGEGEEGGASKRSVSPVSTSSSSSSSCSSSPSLASASGRGDRVETLLGIFDLRGFGPRNADLRFARFLVDACFLYYPRRLGAVLFVDAPWAFRPVWAVVRPLLRKYGALVRFVSAGEVRELYFAEGEAPPGF